MGKKTLTVPRTEDSTDIWLTPRWVLDPLGDFDLDPCHNEVRPFETARNYYHEKDDGLIQTWRGRVWCNPPYGNQTGLWLSKMARHGNGISLVFAKTETEAFKIAWFQSDGVLFLGKRVQFLRPDGTLPLEPKVAAGSALIAFGLENALTLRTCGLEGAFVPKAFRVGQPNMFEVVNGS